MSVRKSSAAKVEATPFDLPRERRLQPIHQREQVVAHYKSIRKSILEAREKDKKS